MPCSSWQSTLCSWHPSAMSDLLLDALPTRWHGHEIIPDFRPMVWLVNTYVRGQTGDDPIGFAVSALWRFYKDPHCFLNDPQKIIDAYGYMIEFYKAGEKAAESAAAESSTAPSSGLAFDYQCDAGYIVAAFQQAYGIDLTREKVHWFRFRALFAALPEETLMAKIMSWRTMDLSEYEGSMRDRYADLQERFALPAELRGGAARVVSVEEHDAEVGGEDQVAVGRGGDVGNLHVAPLEAEILETLRRGVIARQSRRRADPEQSPVGEQRIDRVVAQALRIALHAAKHGERVAVIAVQPVLRSHPDTPHPVLRDGQHGTLRQAFVDRQRAKFDRCGGRSDKGETSGEQ